MRTRFIVVSQKKNINETFFSKSPCFTNMDSCVFYPENKESLAKVYNKELKQCRISGIDVAVFVHDDVYINCNDIITRLEKYSQMYTVFGLAGTKAITVSPPALWHLMSKREDLRGCVAHGKDENEYFYTTYGPIPSRAVMIDGVFIAINVKELPEHIQFDENCPSKFHYYDLIFSLECSLNKIKVGVGDVPIIHNSPGLRNMSDEWKAGQSYFLQKYDKFKGKTLTV